MRRLLALFFLIAPCLVMFAAFMSGCSTPEPGRRDLVLSDPKGEAVFWVKPSGEVVLAKGVRWQEVVKQLVTTLDGQGRQLVELKAKLSPEPKPTPIKLPKPLPRPSLLKDGAP